MDFLIGFWSAFYGWPLGVVGICLALLLGMLLMTILE